MTESCRLVTTEQYKEYQLLKKKLDIVVEALKLYAELDIIGEEARQALKEIEEVK